MATAAAAVAASAATTALAEMAEAAAEAKWKLLCSSIILCFVLELSFINNKQESLVLLPHQTATSKTAAAANVIYDLSM